MTQPEIRTVPVAIVGGGPVGMLLALFLDRLGVKSVLFNIDETTRWHPRGSTQGSRTMEHYRRLGIADAIRQLGLPIDHPTDVAYFTRFNGIELARLPMPSANDVMAQRAQAAKLDQNPEPIHRGNQMQVETLCVRTYRIRARTSRCVFGWCMENYEQDADGVTLLARSKSGDRQETWRAQYLVGCDGGRSDVCWALGISFRGDTGLEQRRWRCAMVLDTVFAHAGALRKISQARRRFGKYWAVDPEIRSHHDRRRWAFRNYWLLTQATTADGPPEGRQCRGRICCCCCTGADIGVRNHRPCALGCGRCNGRGKVRDNRVRACR